ncbi:MAG: hydantoinase B/oxoprolinase family protein [Acetobacteraceae bacterium]|nr:hydantoinase B/oxoprolinase family protein [Acetobacteraceae bacterium]
MTALDPVTLAVLKGRLEQVADEMDATLARSAFNPIIAEARDLSHGLYHAETGATLVQGSSGLPIFVGATAFAVRAVIERAAARGGPRPGETWAFNDPYLGGTHLNDMRLVRPVFRRGRLFCWLASVAHWLDVGGAVPGGYNPRATESHQEGVRIPPVVLAHDGALDEDVLAILQANTRTSLANWGDLNGQLNALDLGERRLAALLDEAGEETVAAALEALTARAEAMMRSALARLPDGAYEAEDFLDNDGLDPAPLPIRLRLTIAGDRAGLDFSGSAPACAGPLNISRATAIAACYVALKHLFPEVPANGGCLAPITITIPEGSILAADAPRPVAGYTETILRVIDVIFRAFAEAAPDRAIAGPFATINALSISGRRADASRWVMFCFFGGGLGATPHGDGLNHGNNPISTATMPPLEILEASYPIRFTEWALRPDSAGAGTHRGGLGAIYEIAIEDEGGAEAFLLGERGLFPPFGVAGGGPAAANRFAWETDDGWRSSPMVSKAFGLALARGRRLRLETPGGGGWGDPMRRDLGRVARDVRLGYVSPAAARDLYGVALRADGSVDAEATAALRRERAA